MVTKAECKVKPMPSSEKHCELCGRAVERLERHHLIPRARHGSGYNRRTFGRQEVRERLAMFCRPCHKTVHAILDEKQLERQYNTLDVLRAHPEIARFIRWVRKQPPGKRVHVHRPVHRRRRKGRRG